MRVARPDIAEVYEFMTVTHSSPHAHAQTLQNIHSSHIHVSASQDQLHCSNDLALFGFACETLQPVELQFHDIISIQLALL